MGNEGGVTFGDVWNAFKDVATLMQNGQSVQMGGTAFAVPAGHQPSQLDWSQSGQQTIEYRLTWTNRAREWFDASTGTLLRLGAVWYYNGSLDGQGQYLANASLYAILDYSSLGTNFNVSGAFGDPMPMGSTVMLPGTINVDMSYAGMHWETIRLDVRLHGNGAGAIRRL